jgi:peptide/nickel transport system substrate-binding protein
VPAGLQWEFYGDMFVQGWSVPEFDLAKARDLVKASGYRGDPITYRLINNYYTNQVFTAQALVEMWRQAGLNVQISVKENWTQIFERGPEGAASAPGRTRRCSMIRCPRSSARMARTASSSSMGERTNEEMNRLSLELETSTDRALFASRSSPACCRSPSARTRPIRCCTRTRRSPPSARTSSGGRRRRSR